MVVVDKSALVVSDIFIPVMQPLLTMVYIGDNFGRIIKSKHENFRIDEKILLTQNFILNNNFKINIEVKRFSEVKYHENFIYDDMVWAKIKIYLGDTFRTRGYDIFTDTLKVINPIEEVFLIQENK